MQPTLCVVAVVANPLLQEVSQLSASDNEATTTELDGVDYYDTLSREVSWDE
jgi:hypothetical protein